MKEETRNFLAKDLNLAATRYNKEGINIPESVDYSDFMSEAEVDEFIYCEALFDLAIDFYQIEKENKELTFPEDSFARQLLQAIDPEGQINDEFVQGYNKLGSSKDKSDYRGNTVSSSFSNTQNKFEKLFSNANFKKAHEAFSPIGDLISSRAQSMVLTERLPEDIDSIYFYQPGIPAVVTKDGITLTLEDYSKRSASKDFASEIETEMEER